MKGTGDEEGKAHRLGLGDEVKEELLNETRRVSESAFA